MTIPSSIATVADLLVHRLEQHGVKTIFGYPGGQLTPLYDALARNGSIRHVLARDEQAAAFMADGHARASGQPAVCLAVCGPGVYNAFTPLASAYTDSVPVLLLSGQIATPGLGNRSGYYHENEQLRAVQSLVKKASRISDSASAAEALDDAFRVMTTGRPGPVFLEIPLDVQRQTAAPGPALVPPGTNAARPPAAQEIEELVRRVQAWTKPLLIVGGGAVSANASQPLARLATRLGAPVFHSFLGKSALSADHPLKMGLPWSRATSDLTDMGQFLSPLFDQADGAIALGCRFTQALTGSWTLRLPTNLVHVDIDPEEIGRHYPVVQGIIADARLTLEALLAALPDPDRNPWAKPNRSTGSWRLPGFDLVGPLRQCLPREAIVVADITRLSYILLADFPVYEARTFLHPAGFVPMGYGLPAALGAKLAHPNRPVVAVVGDGCLLMSAMELATAVQERIPVVVVLINDRCLTLIKAIQERRYQKRFLGVDLSNPDWGGLARSFGVASWQVKNDQEFTAALQGALALNQPALIEVLVEG